jgi:hypothetical protein
MQIGRKTFHFLYTKFSHNIFAIINTFNEWRAFITWMTTCNVSIMCVPLERTCDWLTNVKLPVSTLIKITSVILNLFNKDW